MNKLLVTKTYINKFSVATVKDFEGCPDALKMLYQRYGDEVAILSSRKQDFIDLTIKDNKPHWTINFILNLMKENYRLMFYEDYFEVAVYRLGDKKIATDCQKAFLAVKKNKVTEYPKLLSLMQSIVSKRAIDLINTAVESEVKLIHFQIFLCESVIMLLRDDKRVLTRSVNAALSKIAEAQSILDIDLSRDNVKLKSIALKLIDYSELFED